MISDSQEVFGAIVTEALIADLMPWPCPSYIGPDDRYRLEELLAATSLSLVYRATDLRLSDQGFEALVAIKIARHANQSVVKEGAAIRRISHRYVLAVFDHGVIDECEYTVTELVEGGTLDDKKVPLTHREAAELMVKLARGMQAAHAAGVFHLDLKPANVLLTKDGEPRIADFGYGRLENEDAGPARGNLAFMSPEQYAAADDALTSFADIYSLGGILHYLLSGSFPHGETAQEIEEFHRQGQLPPPPTPDCRVLNIICAKAMARQPKDRYASAGELANDLENWLRHEPIAWMRPTNRERFVLTWKRNPRLVLAWGAAGLFFAAAVWIGAVFADREWKREELAQARANQIRVAEFDRVAAELSRMAKPLFGGDISEFPMMVIVLQRLYGVAEMGPDNQAPSFEELNRELKRYVASQEASGQGESIDTALAYLCLASVQLDSELWDEAGETMKTVRLRWTSYIKSKDRYWDMVDGLEFLAVAGADAAAAETTQGKKAVAKRISKWVSANDPKFEVNRLATKIVRRIEKKINSAEVAPN